MSEEAKQPINDSQLAEELRKYTQSATNQEVLERLNAQLTPPIQLIISQHGTGEIDISVLNGISLDIQHVQAILSAAQSHLLRTVVNQVAANQAKAQEKGMAAETAPDSEPKNRAARRRNRRPS